MVSASKSARFELRLELDVEMLTTIRRFVESLYARLLDDELAARVAMTAHELIDNAMRYATAGEVFVRIEIADGAVRIHTENRAEERHIVSLQRAFGEMEKSDNAMQYYLELMDRTARRTDISGLGLGRVWAEADMNLSLETRSDTVSVLAQVPVQGKVA